MDILERIPIQQHQIRPLTYGNRAGAIESTEKDGGTASSHGECLIRCQPCRGHQRLQLVDRKTRSVRAEQQTRANVLQGFDYLGEEFAPTDPPAPLHGFREMLAAA